MGNSPVEKDKLIRFANGFERSFLNCFRMIVGILPVPTALWTLRVLISASTLSGHIGERKKYFSDCLFKYESKVLVVFGIFLTSFPTIELKNLLKWLEITLSSVIVSYPYLNLCFVLIFSLWRSQLTLYLLKFLLNLFCYPERMTYNNPLYIL